MALFTRSNPSESRPDDAEDLHFPVAIRLIDRDSLYATGPDTPPNLRAPTEKHKEIPEDYFVALEGLIESPSEAEKGVEHSEDAPRNIAKDRFRQFREKARQQHGIVMMVGFKQHHGHEDLFHALVEQINERNDHESEHHKTGCVVLNKAQLDMLCKIQQTKGADHIHFLRDFEPHNTLLMAGAPVDIYKAIEKAFHETVGSNGQSYTETLKHYLEDIQEVKQSMQQAIDLLNAKQEKEAGRGITGR